MATSKRRTEPGYWQRVLIQHHQRFVNFGADHIRVRVENCESANYTSIPNMKTLAPGADFGYVGYGIPNRRQFRHQWFQ
jgi:hypothetical protein